MRMTILAIQYQSVENMRLLGQMEKQGLVILHQVAARHIYLNVMFLEIGPKQNYSEQVI